VTTLVLATGNLHKVQEIQAILGNGFRFFTLKDFPGAPKTVENAATFSGNASKKAIELARWLCGNSNSVVQPSNVGFVLADDSGLEVDALNGAPGIHSARFAANEKNSGNSSDAANKQKLLALLKGVPVEKRAARFRCVIALTPLELPSTESSSSVCYADELELRTELFDGVCDGKIITEERGENGFGYDPLFVPNGFDETFAELGDEIKNQISHRAKALEKLQCRLNKHSD
jgi:XTP/dITP diphosphohydrolase